MPYKSRGLRESEKFFSLVQWKVTPLSNKVNQIISDKINFLETPTCQLAHYFVIIVFLALNNIQKVAIE